MPDCPLRGWVVEPPCTSRLWSHVLQRARHLHHGSAPVPQYHPSSREYRSTLLRVVHSGPQAPESFEPSSKGGAWKKRRAGHSSAIDSLDPKREPICRSPPLRLCHHVAQKSGTHSGAL